MLEFIIFLFLYTLIGAGVAVADYSRDKSKLSTYLDWAFWPFFLGVLLIALIRE